MKQDYLTFNPYSRSGKMRRETLGVVVHWIGNPGTGAQFNRDYFEDLKVGVLTVDHTPRYASAHYIVGLDGKVVQCMPSIEVAWHVGSKTYTDKAKAAFGAYCDYPNNSPNLCTIGVELCHPDWSGKFTKQTFDSAACLFSSLLSRYDLGIDNIYRHYDITGKDCPRWFVKNIDEFERFKNTVGGYLWG